MYSFNYHGFCIETLAKHCRRGVSRIMTCQLQVSDRAFGLLKRRIDYFRENRERFSYTRLGVILCLLRIPFRRKNYYFCSQFVAELLTCAGAVRLSMPPPLYLPNHLMKELACSLQLMRVRVDSL